MAEADVYEGYGGNLRLKEGPFKDKTVYRCPECMRGISSYGIGRHYYMCRVHGKIPEEDVIDLRKIETDPRARKRAREEYEFTLGRAKEKGFATVKEYYDSFEGDSDEAVVTRQWLRLAIGIEEVMCP